MSRFLLEVFVFLLLFLALRAILRTFLEGYRAGSRPRASRRDEPPASAGGELKKDPVCGTYVAAAASVTRNVHGEVLYFCSEACKARYREER